MEAGKPTVPRILSESCGSIKGIDENDANNRLEEEFVQVYYMNHGICIYYYLSGEELLHNYLFDFLVKDPLDEPLVKLKQEIYEQYM